jgi:uncharacterized OB-fold protein
LLRPRIATGLEREFWEHCFRGALHFQRCEACERWRHPPRHACATCGSDRWHWAASSGRGRLFTWSLTHRASHPALADAVPYATVIVELAEGVRLVSVVRDVAPEALRLDLPLRVGFEALAEDVAMPVFFADEA